jgi:Rod binding domain-containing protein
LRHDFCLCGGNYFSGTLPILYLDRGIVPQIDAIGAIAMADLSPFAARAAAGVPRAPASAAKDQALREAALALEAQFLSEMLKSAGLGTTPEGFGGGAGEEQFTSLLRDEQAGAMARHGGIGLAESLFEAMKRRQGDAD